MSQTPNDIALAETFHHSEDISGVRQDAGFIQLTEAHYAPFVDDDYCPLAGPALSSFQRLYALLTSPLGWKSDNSG